MSTVSTVPSVKLPDVTKVPFGRLVLVEWRKLTDTRAGQVLMIITGGLLVLLAAVILLVIGLNDSAKPGASGWSQAMSLMVSFLIPVLAIMSVTQEWGQRTAMVTFSLEPNRVRVVLAKLVAVVVLGIATIALAVVLGAVGNVIGAAIGGYDAAWNVTVSELLWTVSNQILSLLCGFGLAMLLLNTAGSIALYYVTQLILPAMVYGILTQFFDWARSLIPWIDMTYALTPLQTGQTSWGENVDVGATDIARLVVAVALWVIVPLGLGVWRMRRAEVK